MRSVTVGSCSTLNRCSTAVPRRRTYCLWTPSIAAVSSAISFHFRMRRLVPSRSRSRSRTSRRWNRHNPPSTPVPSLDLTFRPHHLVHRFARPKGSTGPKSVDLDYTSTEAQQRLSAGWKMSQEPVTKTLGAPPGSSEATLRDAGKWETIRHHRVKLARDETEQPRLEVSLPRPPCRLARWQSQRRSFRSARFHSRQLGQGRPT